MTLEAPPWRQRIARWWYVLQYHRKSQLAMRLVSAARRRLHRLTGGRRYARLPAVLPKPRENPGFGPLLQSNLTARRAEDSAGNARRILEGRFRFLNREQALPDPVDWRIGCWPEAPLLWRFHLHYHEFLLDLLAEGLRSSDPVWFDRAWQLVAGWIEGNPLGDGRVLMDAWHPYCISRRLLVWILLWTASAPVGELADRVIASMFSQAKYLERHLERDVCGNHLLENARALAMIGAFLEGPDADRWLRAGGRVMRAELAQQILPHGEHFERSPMYHARMLEAVLDVRDAAAAVLPELSNFCAAKAAKMATFLQEILHPDGEIPLLGDSCLGETAPAGHVIARTAGAGPDRTPTDRERSRASRQSPLARVVGDYWIYRQGKDFLVFDAGPAGPDHLPAHAHADLLTLEASIQSRRLFVDSGVFNYQGDAMRRYCRGSPAHNVLVIDDCDQCDVWSRFRMGYRGWPSGFTAGEARGFHWSRAHHNAYRRLGVPVVGRWVACRPGGPWFCVDWAEGSGDHKLTSGLHLHPDVEVEQTAPDAIRIRCHGVTLHLRPLTPGSLTVTTGWYCPQLGHRLRCPLVQWTTTATLPSVCGWYLVWGEPDAVASLTPFKAEDTVLRWEEKDQPLKLRPIGKT